MLTLKIFLYSFALMKSKSDLVEGSIVGSLLAGVLLMPGLSMVSGAIRRKEQRFNAKSAGVTSTMLIMSCVGVLTPTFVYEIFAQVRACIWVHTAEMRSSSSRARAARPATPAKAGHARAALTRTSRQPTIRSTFRRSATSAGTAPASCCSCVASCPPS